MIDQQQARERVQLRRDIASMLNNLAIRSILIKLDKQELVMLKDAIEKKVAG